MWENLLMRNEQIGDRVVYAHSSPASGPVRTGDGGSPKAPLWQGELPLRRRGGPPRDDRPQLLRGGPEPGRDAAAGPGERGAGRGRALPGGAKAPGGPSQCRLGGAGGGVTAAAEGALKEAFKASFDLFEVVVGWLGGHEAAQLAHAELEDRLSADMRRGLSCRFPS